MQLVSITTNDVILYPAHVVLDTTLCDEVCQWFSPSTPVSSTNKIYRPDINEILLKVALRTISLTPIAKKHNCLLLLTKKRYIKLVLLSIE